MVLEIPSMLVGRCKITKRARVYHQWGSSGTTTEFPVGHTTGMRTCSAPLAVQSGEVADQLRGKYQRE